MGDNKTKEFEQKQIQLDKLTDILASEFCAMNLNCKIDGAKCENCTFRKFYANTATNLFKKGVRVMEDENNGKRN